VRNSLKRLLKKLLGTIAGNTVKFFDRLVALAFPDQAGLLSEAAIDAAFGTTRLVRHGEVTLELTCPGPVAHFRARTFSTKEPETLAWIDQLDVDVLWDIGANVGLYSLYAAKRHPLLHVYAFEPSVLNLELLARNIAFNQLTDRITIVPMPMSAMSGAAPFTLSNLSRGGALSAFGTDCGFDGEKIEKALVYGMYGISMDDFAEKLGVPLPGAIKMDVDGIEHLILRGGPKTLANPTLKSALIEINYSFDDQRDACQIAMKNAGLELKDRVRTGTFGAVFNTIWVRGK
jgi:FkbM family methyltransferase